MKRLSGSGWSYGKILFNWMESSGLDIMNLFVHLRKFPVEIDRCFVVQLF
jgi:hypothetical protein